MIVRWPCPAPGGPSSEYAFAVDDGRPVRILIVPALFDEANRLRRFTVETMRALAAAGIDSVLPDLPGTNESFEPLTSQTLAGWREAMAAAAAHFHATHALGIRGGGLLLPALPGWTYAPVSGSALLRQMLRIRQLAAREAGRDERPDALLAEGLRNGLDLAGYALGPALIEALQDATPNPASTTISQADIGGPGLWLRAEPGENRNQSEALAATLQRAVSQ